MRIQFTMALAFLLLVAGCPSETVSPPPSPPVNWQSFDASARGSSAPSGPTESERAASELYIAALASPGFAALGARLDEDAHFIFPGTDDAHGRDSIIRAHDKLLGAVDPRKVVAVRVWRTSNEQTVEWELTGVQTRDWMGIKPSQKRVRVKGIALIWTKDDGSITDLHLYFDIAAVKAQLGVGPKELVAATTRELDAVGDAGVPAAPEITEQSSSPAEQTNVAAARAALDALENNNLAAYEDAMADDVEVHTLERSQPARGKSGASAYFTAMHKAIGQLDTTVTDAWGLGSFVVLEYTIAGVQLGPIGWFPSQRERAILLHIVDIVDIVGGKVARIWRYDNPGELVVASPPG
jgi:ketosteroid isomerase-like protein